MMLKIAILSAVAFTLCMADRSSRVSPSVCEGIMKDFIISAFKKRDPYVLNKPLPCSKVELPISMAIPKVEFCLNENRILNLGSAERIENCSAPDARDSDAVMTTVFEFDILYAKSDVTLRVEGMKPMNFTLKVLVDDVRCDASLELETGYHVNFAIQSVGKIVYKIEGLPEPVASLASSLSDEEIKKNIRHFLDKLFSTELTNAVSDDLESLVKETLHRN